MIEVFESFAARQPGQGLLTVTRTTEPSPSYDSDGYKVAGTTSTIPIIAQVYPTNGRDLKILADQGITSESRALLTATKLFTRDNGFAPDQVAGVDLDDDGVPWIVCNWQQYTAPDSDVFYRVLVARQALK